MQNRISDIYRPAEERKHDFREVERKISPEELHAQSERCMHCGIPFCHGHGCPLHNIIPEVNAAAAAGDWEKAYRILSSTASFPEFTGRVCPALCENACVQNAAVESPVMVRQIEKAVIENAYSLGLVKLTVPATKSGKKVAVVGAGPSGLALAQELVKMGHSVVVFERSAAPGGLMRYGIPDFKLEKSVIDRRIRVLELAGVRFEFNTEVGRDVAGAYLLRRFDAVAVAVGTPLCRDLKIPGRELGHVHFALELLGAQTRFNAGETAAFPFDLEGKKVLIIGGGDTGSDCVGTANRNGAAEVTQIELMPKPPEKRSFSTPWPDWAYMLRTSSSHLESCKRLWSVNSKRFLGRDGVLEGVEVVDLEWELSPAGRPLKFTEKPGSGRVIPCDYAFLALGFLGVPKDGLAAGLGLAVDERGKLQSDASRGVFVCGDAASGQSLVVRAIASGRAAAAEIDRYLKSANH